MSTNDTSQVESTELDDRTRRALTEYMTVLETGGGVYEVVGENENSYTVDVRAGVCTCPDSQHRNARCKHQRRVAFATGRNPLPAGVEDVDDDLGRHVDRGPVMTDGGEILDADDGILEAAECEVCAELPDGVDCFEHYELE